MHRHELTSAQVRDAMRGRERPPAAPAGWVADRIRAGAPLSDLGEGSSDVELLAHAAQTVTYCHPNLTGAGVRVGLCLSAPEMTGDKQSRALALGFQCDPGGAQFICVSASVENEISWGELIFRGAELDGALAAARAVRERWRAAGLRDVPATERSALICQEFSRQALADAMRQVHALHHQMIHRLAERVSEHVHRVGLPTLGV